MSLDCAEFNKMENNLKKYINSYIKITSRDEGNILITSFSILLHSVTSLQFYIKYKSPFSMQQSLKIFSSPNRTLRPLEKLNFYKIAVISKITINWKKESLIADEETIIISY